MVLTCLVAYKASVNIIPLLIAPINVIGWKNINLRFEKKTNLSTIYWNELKDILK